MTPAEHFLGTCLVNVFRQRRAFHSVEKELAFALLTDSGSIGSAVTRAAEETDEELKNRDRWTFLDGEKKLTKDQWNLLKGVVDRHLDRSRIAQDETSRLIDAVIALFQIPEGEASVFRLVAWANLSSLHREIYDALGIGRPLTRTAALMSRISVMLNMPDAYCRSALSSTSILFRTGLLMMDDDGDIALASNLFRVLHVERPTPSRLAEALLGARLETDLRIDDYPHVIDDWNYLQRLLRGAIRKRAAGINILVHGEPGTGKTEFSKALACSLGVPIHAAGKASDDGSEPSRSDRLTSLRSLQRLLAAQKKGLVLVDEAQDIFNGQRGYLWSSRRSEGSRAFVHELLENLPVPVIWTANDISQFGDPVLRRMSYILELRTPPHSVRARNWEKKLTESNIKHTVSEIDQLSRDFPFAPAVTATSVRSASLSRGGLADIRRVATSIGTAMGHRKSGSSASSISFDHGLTNANLDLTHLTRQLSQLGRQDFSICLYGPPGTGKSAYAEELAKSMGLEIVKKRYSDLVSPYIGETEQAIAKTFRDAAASKALLIIDEADSLLRSRHLAVRGWEITQVNEMLTWMEAHPFPFICTTNLIDDLDAASLRRFTFKVHLNYLSPDQVSRAFREFFNHDATGTVKGITHLTPGDFHVVRRKIELLGIQRDSPKIIAMLEDEAALKPGRRRAIGF